MPDAKLYGDEGSNTLGNIALQVGLHIPNMQKWAWEILQSFMELIR